MRKCGCGKSVRKSYFICLSHLGINHVGDGIQRRSQREKFHIKTLYCLECDDVVECMEVRYCDYFPEIMEKAEKLHNEIYEKKAS